MDYEIDAQDLDERPTASMRATLVVADIGSWLPQAYEKTATLLAGQGAGPVGPPFARYRMLGDERFEVEAGFPASKPVAPEGDVEASTLPGGPVAHTVHLGPYDTLGAAYQALNAWIGDQGGEPAGDPWEEYFSDPVSQPDPATWRTEVYAPYRR